MTWYDVSNEATIEATPAEIVDVPGSYSKVMQEGFRAIERFTARRRTESQA